MFSITLVTVVPCLVILLSGLIIRRSIWAFAAVIFAIVSTSVASTFLRSGVVQSCKIDESECLGATATSYMIVALWGMCALALLFRIAVVLRSPA